MRILVDTNVFLEILLDQAKADEARALLLQTDRHEFLISDYALHSIGVLLFRRNQLGTFASFVEDVIVSGCAALVSLAPGDMTAVMAAADRFRLDFDDAYQYAASRKLGLRLVSYDADFDRTPDGRLLPALAPRLSLTVKRYAETGPRVSRLRILSYFFAASSAAFSSARPPRRTFSTALLPSWQAYSNI